ncbi:hypothetical protein ACOSP7_022384 [Xanthoceras sorbifolium]
MLHLWLKREECGLVTPSRGLRQGDPLSPYLFFICAEGLSQLFSKAEDDQLISGFRCSRYSPSISHLLFADDSLLFLQASTSECHNVDKILVDYSLASGQVINFENSAMCCSKQVSKLEAHQLAYILGVQLVGCHKKYLGLPSFTGKNKSKLFNSIKSRVWDKLKGWNCKLFSASGREVLLKAAIQSIPAYSMNLF